MDEKLDMTLTLVVKGKEGLKLTLEYIGTDMPTVLAVEGALLKAVAELNAKK
jgi:hypothetical protein